MTQDLSGGGFSRSVIAPQWPQMMAVHPNSILDIQFEYGEANSGKNHIFNILFQVTMDPGGEAALNQVNDNPGLIASVTRTVNPEAVVQVVQTITAIQAQTETDSLFVVPNFLSGEVILIDTVFFGQCLDNWFLAPVRRIVSNRMIFKKVKISVYSSPTDGVGNYARIPLESRRKIENFSFICPTGLHGIGTGQINPKALTFSRYARDSSTTSCITNVVDRPSRFLIRGAVLPEGQVYTNSAVLSLVENLRTQKILRYGNVRNIYFTPKINFMNDLLSVRSVICVGYTSVPGQPKGQASNVAPPPGGAAAPPAAKAAPETPQEGGNV